MQADRLRHEEIVDRLRSTAAPIADRSACGAWAAPAQRHHVLRRETSAEHVGAGKSAARSLLPYSSWPILVAAVSGGLLSRGRGVRRAGDKRSLSLTCIMGRD
jgi:hypothetical protein